MVKRIGTARRKTRHKLKQTYRTKGKIPLSKYFQELGQGDKVSFSANCAVSKGMYHPRFHGKVGKVINKRGFCYIIEVKDGNKMKTFNVHPIHLKKV
ncbi:MAG: 50S ribosomal protein L21e [Candidatus Woesearchaeota archaeon]